MDVAKLLIAESAAEGLCDIKHKPSTLRSKVWLKRNTLSKIRITKDYIIITTVLRAYLRNAEKFIRNLR